MFSASTTSACKAPLVRPTESETAVGMREINLASNFLLQASRVGSALFFQGSRLAEVQRGGSLRYSDSRQFLDVCLVKIAHCPNGQGRARPESRTIRGIT